VKKDTADFERYRLKKYSSSSDGKNGAFLVPIGRKEIFVIISDGAGWDHLSASLRSRTPTWEEMNFLKDLFFEDEETVVQYHPKKSEYVNNHDFCLHLWRKHGYEFQLPPSIMVGAKELK